MKQLRDLALLALLFGVVAVFTIYGPASNRPSDDGARGSAHSKGDEGSLALQLWLRSLGYTAENLEYTSWEVPADADAILMIATDRHRITADEATVLLDWVRAGGTLINISERRTNPGNPDPLWDALGASLAVSTTNDLQPAERAEPSQPILTEPLVTSVEVQTALTVALNEDPFVPLLTTRYGPVLVGRQVERGYVVLGVSAVPFLNMNLTTPGSGAMILNLLARVPAGGRILFDEYHHGFRTAPTVGRATTSSWWGWSLLYAGLVVLLYILLTGRRFGRAVPVRQEIARRSSAEYVVSMANLFRRAGKRQDIAAHYHAMLKRRLAQPHGFVPAADDEQFLHDLERWTPFPTEQHAQLATLLSDLRNPKLSEADLLRLAQAADSYIQPKGRAR